MTKLVGRLWHWNVINIFPLINPIESNVIHQLYWIGPHDAFKLILLTVSCFKSHGFIMNLSFCVPSTWWYLQNITEMDTLSGTPEQFKTMISTTLTQCWVLFLLSIVLCNAYCCLLICLFIAVSMQIRETSMMFQTLRKVWIELDDLKKLVFTVKMTCDSVPGWLSVPSGTDTLLCAESGPIASLLHPEPESAPLSHSPENRNI